jgi:serine/threonine protein kinase
LTDPTEKHAETIFREVTLLPVEERDAALNRMCRDDHVLRSRVERLLLRAVERDLGGTTTVSAASPGSASLIGREVAPFRIVAKIGEGGMGEVYEARDNELRRTVALKFLASRLSQDPAASKRLLRSTRCGAGRRSSDRLG